MKKIVYWMIVSILLINLPLSTTSLSSSVHVWDYLKDRFPAIFNLYLKSLEDLDPNEIEFINLLEKLPEDEQRIYVRKVYNDGFSLELLEQLKELKTEAEEPFLNVAYPSGIEQKINGSPLFVFGSTDSSPEIRVTVNDEEVKKFDYRTGNFLTLVEIPIDEEFPIVVTASRKGEQTSVERSVIYPRPWQEMPIHPLSIHHSHVQPIDDQVLTKSDQLIVMVQGSPEVEAVFRIGKNSKEIKMEEILDLPEPLEGRGVYMGSYTVQAEDIPILGVSSPQIITVTLKREGQKVSKELPGKVFFVSDLPFRIVEVIENPARIYRVKEDSYVFYGSGLGGNGISTELIDFDVLPGTHMKVIGGAGSFLRVRLGEDNYLIHHENVKDVDYTTKKSLTSLSKIELSETQDEIKMRLDTRECIPFLIEDDSQKINIILYHVEKSEYLKKEGEAPSLQNIEIKPLNFKTDEAVMIGLELNQPVVGFDYYWEGTELIISIRKPPEIFKAYPLREKTIVIDPGHGGKYPGAIGPRDIHEKDVVLEISKFLSNILEDRGAKVIMTRTEDMNVELQERIDFAVQNDADLFVSIHANSHAVGADALNYHGSMTLYNYKYNQKLAEIMLDSIVEKMKLPKARVWKRSDLVVLRRPQVPSVLIETAFLMHPDDNWYLLQPVHQKEFAEAMMNGIIDYFCLF